MTSSAFTARYELLRELLIKCRKNAKVTQKELAQRLKKPQSFVSKFETGERRLDLIEFLDVVAILQIDIYQFIEQLEGNCHNTKILQDWQITNEQLTQLLNNNPSLKGMLFGYVAELKLKEIILSFPEVSFTRKYDDHNRKKKGDLYVIYKEKAFNIESESLQSSSIKYIEGSQKWLGKAQVDASDRKTVYLPNGENLNTTLLLRGEFDVLVVNCYGFEDKWKFIFARNLDLPGTIYRKYSQEAKKALIASLITVTCPPEFPFYYDLRVLLDEMIDEGLGSDIHDLE